MWDCLCNAVQAAAFRHAADLPPTFLSEGIVANNGCGLPYTGVVPCCTRTRHGRANWAMPVVEVHMLSLQAKCARSVRAAIFRSKMARTAKNAIRTRKPSCGFLRILTTPIIRCARLFTLACRTNVIVGFAVMFNLCCFFVDYEIVRAVWDIVGERARFKECIKAPRAKDCEAQVTKR